MGVITQLSGKGTVKLVSVLVGLSGGMSNFSSKSAQPKLLVLRSDVCFGL